MKLAREARPRLIGWARLKLDRKAGNYVLLYPEKGLLLTDSAAQLLRLCTGQQSVSQIVERLRAEHPAADPARIEADVFGFLGELAARGLLIEAP